MADRAFNNLFGPTKRNRVVILENVDFVWEESELETIRLMWLNGESLEQIINAFNRDGDEVFLAILHLARKKRLKGRELCCKG